LGHCLRRQAHRRIRCRPHVQQLPQSLCCPNCGSESVKKLASKVNAEAPQINRAPNEKHLVWTTGMARWADAKTVPAFTDLFRANPPPLPALALSSLSSEDEIVWIKPGSRASPPALPVLREPPVLRDGPTAIAQPLSETSWRAHQFFLRTSSQAFLASISWDRQPSTALGRSCDLLPARSSRHGGLRRIWRPPREKYLSSMRRGPLIVNKRPHGLNKVAGAEIAIAGVHLIELQPLLLPIASY
jgi:hypothetical protein